MKTAANILSAAVLFFGLLLYSLWVPLQSVPQRTEYFGGSVNASLLEGEENVTGFTAAAAQVITGTGEQLFAEIIYAQENYAKIYPVEMLSGSFRLEEGTAVIGECAAAKLFLTHDAVGKKIAFFGAEYTVSGVYDEPKGMLDELSGGIDRVYVLNPGRDITAAAALTDGETSCGYRLQYVFDREFTAVNLPEEAVLADLPRLLFGIVLVFCAAGVMFVFLQRTVKRTAAVFRNAPFAFALRQNLKEVLRHICLLLLAGSAFAALLCTMDGLCIPRRFLPEDGVFRLREFLSLLSEYLRAANSVVLSRDIRRIRLVGVAELFVYTPLAVLCFTAALRLMRELRNKEN